MTIEIEIDAWSNETAVVSLTLTISKDLAGCETDQIEISLLIEEIVLRYIVNFIEVYLKSSQ